MVDFVFLDSGTGGIPYLMHLLEIKPDAKCVYVGDTANFPYGEKNHEQIVSAVLNCIKVIIEKFSPKVIVLVMVFVWQIVIGFIDIRPLRRNKLAYRGAVKQMLQYNSVFVCYCCQIDILVIVY